MTTRFPNLLASAALCGLFFAPRAFAAPAPAQAVTIPQVQGAGEVSPLSGRVVAVEGVVTGDFRGPKQLAGFFLQDPKGDGDPNTSDAVFVYVSPRAPFAQTAKAGDEVRVTGRAEERYGQTQIVARSLEVGRVAKPVTPTRVTLPLPLAERERLEGMLVTLPQTLTVAGVNDLDRFGALMLAIGGRTYEPRNGQGDTPETVAPRRLVLDDGSDARNPARLPYLDAQGTRRSGDTVAGLTGILNFSRDLWRLQPTVTPVFANANPRTLAPAPVGGTVRVASFNMHNYWTTLKSEDRDARGAKTQAEHERQAAKSVLALRAMNADVFALMEMENNGDTTVDDLLTRLNAALGAPTYAKVPMPATGLGTDRIRVAMIFKPAALDLSGPSLSDPTAIFERFPMAQTFAPKNGAKPFTLVANHWKSKSPPREGVETEDTDKGQGAWNLKRVEQAKAVAKFVAGLQKTVPDVLVVGDLNAYGDEDPVRELAKSLTLLDTREPVADRYSFVYDGLSGSLDHGFATQSAAARVTGVTTWHINADEPLIFDYLAPQERTVPLAQETFFRSSDHDPLIIGLR